MRDAFFKTLCDLAGRDSRIILLIGDLGFGCTREFEEKFPDRIINAGIAEQNMTGMAAGMAMEGDIVFTYSIANFPLLRCLEQIRNDACYHNANVKIVSVGGGMCYGSLGSSHFSTEDLAIARVIPELTVLAPGDPEETIGATRAAYEIEGPVFLRLGRAGEPKVHLEPVSFVPGKSIVVREGGDVTLMACGGMLYNALRAGEMLADNGISAKVVSMHTVKPVDSAAILRSAEETGYIVTVEEHSRIGGLGGAVAEVLAESDLTCRFRRLGLPDGFVPYIGSQSYLIEKMGLAPESIVKEVMALIK
jgi:transketolase